MKKVVLTGAESTGKTTLAVSVANHFNCPLRAEYARRYLEKKNGIYGPKDIVKIAKHQFQVEKKLRQEKPEFLICDTDFLVFKIWSEFKYGICDPWINQQFEKQEVDLYILPHFNTPFEVDPLREHPDQRHILFQLYEDILVQHQLPHIVVKGVHDERLVQAIDRISTFNFE